MENNENMENIKIINISGLNEFKLNKKENEKEKKNKKRIETINWTFTEDEYKHENQMETILKVNILHNEMQPSKLTKIIIQQINRKIYSYKHQDLLKKLYNKDKFITFKSVINKMIECGLLCYYCNQKMYVLYDICREMNQWSVDRIDNTKGHNFDNFYLACLECNLKRRTKSDIKFLFTKQLKIIKQN